jgi:putative transposase
MGNHVHVLAMPEKETSLARGIGGTNLLYTQYRKDKGTVLFFFFQPQILTP